METDASESEVFCIKQEPGKVTEFVLKFIVSIFPSRCTFLAENGMSFLALSFRG
jgi:hypothetical protein